MRHIIAPSILSCDFANLAADCKRILKAGGDVLHVDIMDGYFLIIISSHFVPNLTIGPPVVKSLRDSLEDIILDCHLMWIKPLSAAGASIFTFHLEAVHKDDIPDLITLIKDSEMRVGIAIKPNTPTIELLPFISKIDVVLVMSVEPGFGGQKFMPSILSKIQEIRYINENIDIEVDGGITLENIKSVVDSGANVIVAGSSIFNSDSPESVIREMKSYFK